MVVLQMSVPTIVTGELVEEPSVSLHKRIKIVSFVYLLNSVWVFYRLSSGHTSTSQWIHLWVTAFGLGVLLPLCGLSSARRPGSGRLACFNGAQGCLGGWNILSFISLVSYMITVALICKECEPAFSMGNSTCVLNETSTGSPTGEILLVDESDCYARKKILSGAVSGMLMLCMAIASCSAAFHGRKTGKAKMVHVITVEPIRFDTSPLILETPQIPEDL